MREWKKGKEEEKKNEEEMDEDTPDQLVIYKQIVELLKPGETVLKVGVIVEGCEVSGCGFGTRL